MPNPWGEKMDLLRYSAKETRRLRVGTESWPSTWPNLSSLLTSLDKTLTCLQVHQVANGHKAIIRFRNNYGLEIFKYPEGDFFEMSVIRFPGDDISTYEFAFDTPLPDLNIGHTDEDIFRLCAQVSELR
jgi:hypothetical protein